MKLVFLLLTFSSEKIAVSFGLLSTSAGPLFAVKNLRQCPDCHTAMKMISKVANREIFLRDANRMHHFKNGKLC